MSLLPRLALVTLLFVLELVPITIWLDGTKLMVQGGLPGLIGVCGAWVLKGLVAFAALFATFHILVNRAALNQVSTRLSTIRLITPSYLAAHFAALAIFAVLARFLYETTFSGTTANLIAVLWLASGVTAIALATGAVIPFRFWRELSQRSAGLSIYALLTSAAVCLTGEFAQTWWGSTARWTFVMVKALLKIFLSQVISDPKKMSIGTPKFYVEIAPQCSGVEGAVLILGFCALWLWLFRREFRFPRALLLAPAGVVLLFFLNAIRITALILIGNAGAPDIAVGGFHSQAGWIAFNGVAIGLMMASRRVQWIHNGPAAAALTPTGEENPAAPYLAPFLVILAAAMIATASSAGFEWLYPLRPLAACAALCFYRKTYKQLDWRFSWEAPAIGTLVFALWLGGDWLNGNHPAFPFTPSADRWIAVAQRFWLAVRVVAPIVTVPIAEELAFRAYLIRRIMSLDFENLSPRAYSAASLLISSLAFGLLHGNRWIAGTIAGLLYAAVYVRRGRIGDAVVAHATTNGLLAASILVTGQWNLS